MRFFFILSILLSPNMVNNVIYKYSKYKNICHGKNNKIYKTINHL